MQRFFVADVHLNENEPEIVTGFFHFLHALPSESELYILGDLFDYWIGDDIVSDLQLNVAKELSELKSRNIISYFIHGNRDFLLGNHFSQVSAMQLLPEIYCISSDSKNILILHGDLLCTDDRHYQKFRKKMHNKWLQYLFLLLPRYFRQKIANKLRNTSREYNQHKTQSIMDVNQDAVEETMAKHRATVMIHGHTHKPATHHFELLDSPVERIVLGAWHDGINYIHQDDNGIIQLVQEPLNKVK